MDRFAAIGTLGLTGRAQYVEVFHSLLVPHELGHWLQMLAQRPLTRWEAEFRANQIMVTFWRECREKPPAPPTEARIANYLAQPQNFPSVIPLGGMSIEVYFDTHIQEIESDPSRYAAFQKFMVRRATEAQPAPSFRELVTSTWPLD